MTQIKTLYGTKIDEIVGVVIADNRIKGTRDVGFIIAINAKGHLRYYRPDDLVPADVVAREVEKVRGGEVGLEE